MNSTCSFSQLLPDQLKPPRWEGEASQCADPDPPTRFPRPLPRLCDCFAPIHLSGGRSQRSQSGVRTRSVSPAECTIISGQHRVACRRSWLECFKWTRHRRWAEPRLAATVAPSDSRAVSRLSTPARWWEAAFSPPPPPPSWSRCCWPPLCPLPPASCSPSTCSTTAPCRRSTAATTTPWCATWRRRWAATGRSGGPGSAAGSGARTSISSPTASRTCPSSTRCCAGRRAAARASRRSWGRSPSIRSAMTCCRTSTAGSPTTTSSWPTRRCVSVVVAASHLVLRCSCLYCLALFVNPTTSFLHRFVWRHMLCDDMVPSHLSSYLMVLCSVLLDRRLFKEKINLSLAAVASGVCAHFRAHQWKRCQSRTPSMFQ